MYKLGRNYRLQIGTASGQTITITPPFTIEFDITRNTLSSANVCSIRIYNLSANHRAQIRYNKFDIGIFQPFTFLAGYGSNLSLVFQGNISQAWSVREGTNFVTSLECFDGGFAFNNGFINQSFPAGSTKVSVIRAVSGQLPNVTVGSIGSFPGTIDRGNALSGNATEILGDLTGGAFFIDAGKVNCLGDSECVPGGLTQIDDSTGLLATPVRELTSLTFDVLFEPRLAAGQYINLQSAEGIASRANFNGIYKVVGIKHRGMISGAVSGDATTSVTLFTPPQAPTVVNP